MCLLSPVHVQTIRVIDHLEWARTIARGVRRSFNFGMRSQEEQDLQSTAYLAVADLVRRFDFAKVPPGGDVNAAFRGWAAIEVRSRCRREARRLRNGGAYHTRRERRGLALVVQSLQDQPALADPRSARRMEEWEVEAANEAPPEDASLD